MPPSTAARMAAAIIMVLVSSRAPGRGKDVYSIEGEQLFDDDGKEQSNGSGLVMRMADGGGAKATARGSDPDHCWSKA